jgi:hypothetical protein
MQRKKKFFNLTIQSIIIAKNDLDTKPDTQPPCLVKIDPIGKYDVQRLVIEVEYMIFV